MQVTNFVGLPTILAERDPTGRHKGYDSNEPNEICPENGAIEEAL